MIALVALHAGAHELPGDAPGWTLSPEVVVPLLLTALLYAFGYRRLSGRSGQGREQHRRQALRFALGWLVLAGALVSPLHEGGERSFTLHMIEHELIMAPAAWLIAVSRPLGVMLWALPTGLRQTLGGGARWWSALAEPVAATGLQALALIVWHAPPLFDRALGHEGWHIAQHLSFLISALLFWYAMSRAAEGAALVGATCLFVTSLIGGGLGALMAFSTSPWYAGYAALGLMPMGLSPAEDQQLAGLIMWIPGGMVHAGAALLLLARALRPREAADAVG
ncbi:cytochrome c oxidase assembly protein [Sphingomonas sp. ID1715]|uniref:cytochrome c oxidase assembly protein n=1 Tax=Sphingomonas sp. ID1715 TaxID=1656898 RepID=UPI001489AF2E|nr:cytochrome c oxidase assembly protein [Sphingomonas sp. ID1715]NNM76274.1 cytochrome c oxidase assembly protein [Sphingomonas sp. ID1715]